MCRSEYSIDIGNMLPGDLILRYEPTEGTFLRSVSLCTLSLFHQRVIPILRSGRGIGSAAACETVLSAGGHVVASVLQRRKVLGWPAMSRCLFVGVGILDQRGLRESSSQKRQPGRERTIGESHGDSDRWEACLRRENLAIVAGRALHVPNFARRIAPRWVDDGVDSRAVHGRE